MSNLDKVYLAATLVGSILAAGCIFVLGLIVFGHFPLFLAWLASW